MNTPRLRLKDGKTPSLFGSHNLSIFRAIRRGNLFKGGRISIYRTFPTSSSEAKRPQRIVKGPER